MSASVDHAADKLTQEAGGFDVAIAPRSWFIKNWHDRKVQKLFIENFIRIRSKHNDNEIIPFRFNDVQNDYHFRRTRRNVVLKSRQQGLSTYELAMKYAKAILFSGRNIRIVPHDPDAEEEFWSRLNVMYDHTPSRFQPACKYRSKEKFEFHDLSKGLSNSIITSLNPRSGQEGKLRSQTLTDAHLTEIPLWSGDQEKVFTALMAAAEKGDITLESTANGKEKLYFYYQQGKKKKGGWTSFFYEWWWLRENRIEGFRFAKCQDAFILLSADQSVLDIWNSYAKTSEEILENRRRLEEARVTEDEIKVCEKILAHLKKLKYAAKDATWHSWEVAEYLAWRRLKIEEFGGLDKKRGEKIFKIEHPENDIDCFDASTRTVISPVYLEVTCEPIEIPDAKSSQEEREAFDRKVRSESFIVAADTSLGGEGSDPAAIEVLSVETGRQAHSEELLISPDLLAYRLVELSDWFNGALIGFERNNTGIATAKELVKLVEPDRIYKELTLAQQRAVADGKLSYEDALDQAEYGIYTSQANKALYAIYLEQAIRSGDLGLSNYEWCTQAQTVVWLNSQKTQWGAMPGFHDDRFIALAIANYIRVTNYAQFMTGLEILPQVGDAR